MPYTKMVLDGKKPKVKEFQKLHQAFTYPAPEDAPLKHDYDVYVQPRDSKEWTKVDTSWRWSMRLVPTETKPDTAGHKYPMPCSTLQAMCLCAW